MNSREKVQTEYGRLLGIEELQRYMGLGRTNAAAIGKRIGAQVKMGSRSLYDRQIIDRYITQVREEQNA